MLIKVSLLVLFLRIFSPLSFVRRLAWIGIVFIPISFVTLAVVWLVYFIPSSPDTEWTSPKADLKRSASSRHINLVLAALGVFTDFYVFAIPSMAVSSLSLSKRRKVGVLALFAVGLL